MPVTVQEWCLCHVLAALRRSTVCHCLKTFWLRSRRESKASRKCQIKRPLSRNNEASDWQVHQVSFSELLTNGHSFVHVRARAPHCTTDSKVQPSAPRRLHMRLGFYTGTWLIYSVSGTDITGNRDAQRQIHKLYIRAPHMGVTQAKLGLRVGLIYLESIWTHKWIISTQMRVILAPRWNLLYVDHLLIPGGAHSWDERSNKGGRVTPVSVTGDTFRTHRVSSSAIWLIAVQTLVFSVLQFFAP